MSGKKHFEELFQFLAYIFADNGNGSLKTCYMLLSLHSYIFSEVHLSQLDTLRLENGKKLDKMENVHKTELKFVTTKCENDMRELKDEHAKRVEEQLCKTEEERNVLLAGFEEEKNRLETRIQKLSAFVDNFMTGSDCQDKFVKVSIILVLFISFSF